MVSASIALLIVSSASSDSDLIVSKADGVYQFALGDGSRSAYLILGHNLIFSSGPVFARSGIQANASDAIPVFKILVGQAKTGKTAYINAIRKEKWDRGIKRSVKNNAEPVLFTATCGQKFIMEFHDIVGSEKPKPFSDSFRNTDGALFFFDLHRRETYKEVGAWYDEVVKVCQGDIPTVLVGTKHDVFGKEKLNVAEVRYHQERDLMEYVPVSSKTMQNAMLPIAYLAKTARGWNIALTEEEKEAARTYFLWFTR